MNKTQVRRLERALRWAADADEQLRWQAKRGQKKRTLWWRQNWWGVGKATQERVSAHGENSPRQKEYAVVCPTACCLAGNVVLAEGDRLVVDTRQASRYGDEPLVADLCVDTAGVVYDIPVRAQRLLGITTNEASHLFSGDNALDALIERAREVSADHGHNLFVPR